MKSFLIKSIAVTSSITLAAVLICYQSGILPCGTFPPPRSRAPRRFP